MNKETNNIFSQPARKSDGIIVPKKQANKELSKSLAEFVEGRVLTKRNLSELNRSQTQSWIPAMSGLARVRESVPDEYHKARFRAKYSRQEPYALVAHVRISTGGVG